MGGGRNTRNARGPKRPYVRPETKVGGATEKGYSAKQARAILGREAEIRKNKNESLHFFNKEGEELKMVQGKGAQVRYRLDEVPKDAIITHNHPRALGKSGSAAIGHSFSVQDIMTAIKTNAQEIRAVTPTYTFSLKRPETGWGITAKQLQTQYKKVYQPARAKAYVYMFKNKFTDESAARANVRLFHSVIRQVAKENGWDYSKKRG